jgi:Zn-dependent metalloprotease
MRYLTAVALAALLLPTGRATAAPVLEPPDEVRTALDALGAAHALFGSASAWPTFVRGFETPPLAPTPEAAAYAFILHHAPLFGVHDPGTQLIVASTIEWRGRHVVRLQQEFAGLPVFGRMAAMRVEADGAVSAFSSNLAPVNPSMPVTPPLATAQARAAALAHAPWPATAGACALGIWISHDGAHLAYRVTLRGTEAHQASHVVLDASTARVLATGTPIRDATGRVFLQNPVRDSDTPTDVELLGLTGDGSTLTGENVVAWQYVPEGTAVQTAVPDTSGDFLYDPAPRTGTPVFDDEFAQVNAYYQLDHIASYFISTHGYSHSRGPINVFVNYVESAGETYDNAFFDDENWSISLGQASNGDFAYDADTIYHEYTHSVVDTLASLVYMAADPMGMIVFPGALHEGLSDTFAVSLTDDPDMGEYILGRNVVNARTCPGNIMGEVHYDGEIIGGANWDIRNEIGADALEAAAYGSLATLHPTSSFKEYAEGVMAAVDSMVTDGDLTTTQRDEVATIFSERGVDVCDRIMRLDDGASYTVELLGMGRFGSGACDWLDGMRMAGHTFPPSIQWGIEVPDDATSLSFTADYTITGGDDYDIAVNVRAGNYIVYEMVDIGWATMPLRVETADATFENPVGPIVLDEYSDPPLEPGEPYFFTVNYLGCPSGANTVSAEVGFDPVEDPEAEVEVAPEEEPEEEPEPEEDAGADAPDPGSITASGGACGCTLVH